MEEGITVEHCWAGGGGEGAGAMIGLRKRHNLDTVLLSMGSKALCVRRHMLT